MTQHAIMDAEGIEKLSLNDSESSAKTEECNVHDDSESGITTTQHIDISSGYPCLCHEDTISYIQRSKVMFIMRGLPGSGKSSLVKQLVLLYPEIVICSADDFFYKEDGTYFRDKEKLSSAHEFCKTKAERAVNDKKLHIAIDNTNIRAWEMRTYFNFARQGGYTVLLVVPCTSWAFDPVQLAQFNTHEVPIEDIQSKIDGFQEVVPYYWGWFLNEGDSVELRTMAAKYFNECVLRISEFSDYLPVLDNGASPSFSDIYCSSSSTQLHCTSFYVGPKHRSERVASYAHSETVTRSLGIVSKLMVTGIVYTHRTAGLRVALDSHQVDLFIESDDDSTSSSRSGVDDDDVEAVKPLKEKKHKKRGSNKHTRSAQMVSEHVDDHVESSSSPQKEEVNAIRSSVSDANENSPKHIESEVVHTCCERVSSKVHITLGYSKTSQASQTGRDFLDVIAFETQNKSVDIHIIALDDHQASIGYYGDGRCVVAFRQPFFVNALFSGCY